MKKILASLFLVFAGVTAAGLSPAFAQTADKDGVIHLTAEESAKFLAATPGVTVVDVRTGKEFDQGHIDGAININYFALDFKQQMSAYDPNGTYLVHCRSGGRSSRAVRIMKSLGFTKIYHMDGGILAWDAAGLDLVTE